MTALLEVEELRTVVRAASGEVAAVDGVSFCVAEGEALGLVGESGCGKTLTALSLVGLLPPGARVLPGSSVRFRGEEFVGAGPERLRRLRGAEIAVIFQEPGMALNPVSSVGRQVAEGLRHHRGLDRRAARARAAELLGEVGIPDPENRARSYPHELSGGMRQRVLIAMALACGPRLLVADEPTTALDATVRAQILDLLDRLRRERGLALLLITHDLASVAEVCDRVAVMYAGHLVETGEVADLFAAPAHPYTRGLLDSLPRVDAPGGRLRPIPGTVPAPGKRSLACRFADRCPRAWDRCRREAPPLLAVGAGGSGWRSRCWLVETGEVPLSVEDGRRDGV